MEDGPIFVSLHAKGSGKLEIRALHDRYSRKDHGYFLPGGERFVTSNREELFCYFDPGDRKPPLNVYFAGYKTMEGFEGHRLMKKLGSPFLLVSEARLEGGCFYMGTREYERMVIKAILHYRDKLEFDSNQVILSGLSMGTFGALYYGCDIRPHAMILGKPLASIGNVAANEKLLRPGGFPTSLDVLMNICGKTDAEAVTILNKKFWSKFTSTDWDHSKFIVSYMIEDDYDTDAYEMLIGHLQSAGVQVYGKGIHGRHNDNTGAIVNWFVSQYEKILREDFGRGETEGC
jgi:accessory secretory protein Asp2